MNWYIWIVAVAAYVIFAAWYFNWKGPLTADEIEVYIADMAKHSSQSPTDPEIVRQFLETDDGKEFVMLNLVRLHKGDVAHPETGEMTTASEILQGYFGPFSKALFRKAGHPVFMGRKKGGYIDSWNSAIDGTTSFPMQLRMSTYLRPKIWVPLLLLLLASLGQNLIFLFELRK